MKQLLILAVACLPGLVATAQYNHANLALSTQGTAQKYTFENMRIYPLFANESFTKAQKDVGRYTTLKEALDRNNLKITEKTSGSNSNAEVNKLFIQNLSSDTVIILGGEVVSGGKQDRMVADDIIIPPKSGKIDMSVYCVEHGRWSPVKGKEGNVSFSYCESSPVVNTKTRKAAKVEKDQTKVWKEVKDVTVKNKSESRTGTYAAIGGNTDLSGKINSYKKFFLPLLYADPRIIGFTVVSGDSILGCDMFATHALLIKHSENLITSYATEAISSGGIITVPYAKVKAYMDSILADETKQDKLIKEKGTLLKNNNSKLHIAVY